MKAAALEIAEAIRSRMHANNWQPADLAVVLGRPIGHVYALLNGRKRISYRTCRELMDCFGEPWQVFLGPQQREDLAEAERRADPVKMQAIVARMELAMRGELPSQVRERRRQSVRQLEREIDRLTIENLELRKRRERSLLE